MGLGAIASWLIRTPDGVFHSSRAETEKVKKIKVKKQLLMERRSAAFVWLGQDETPRRCLRAAIRNPKK